MLFDKSYQSFVSRWNIAAKELRASQRFSTVSQLIVAYVWLARSERNEIALDVPD
jgi:hypothetical protein